MSLSFDREDAPTRAQMEVACDAVPRDLGLDEHQVFKVAHRDTSHAHVHMTINRVHPETGKACSTSHDYRRIKRTLHGLDAEWGLRREPGQERPYRSRLARMSDLRRSQRLGERPFALQLRGRVGEDMARARSWQELVEALKGEGLRLEAPW